MTKVFFSVGMSLDGFIAGPNRGPDNRLGDQGEQIRRWGFGQHSLRQDLGIGEADQDHGVLQGILGRTGASIMGKCMFDEVEAGWCEETPFHPPVFVLTREVRAPWQSPGGTTFHFVNDGIESALRQAREIAGGMDVRIAGGRHVILQYLDARLVDEFCIALSPLFLGEGLRLFEGADRRRISLDLVEAIRSATVTHLRYAVRWS